MHLGNVYAVWFLWPHTSLFDILLLTLPHFREFLQLGMCLPYYLTLTSADALKVHSPRESNEQVEFVQYNIEMFRAST